MCVGLHHTGLVPCPLCPDRGTPRSSPSLLCPRQPLPAPWLSRVFPSLPGGPDPPRGQVLTVHEAGPASAQLHQRQAGERETLGLLCAE